MILTDKIYISVTVFENFRLKNYIYDFNDLEELIDCCILVIFLS